MIYQYMNEYITDVQYFEGFVGAFGTILSFTFFQRTLKLKNMSVIIGLSFLMTWILRKVLMNIYTKIDKENTNKYDLSIGNYNVKGINMYILLIILFTSILVYNIALKKISYMSKLVYVFFIAFFLFFVKQ